MSEFNIKTKVVLDTSKAESQMKELQNLGDKPIEIKIKLGDIESQLKGVKNIIKDAFKLDKGTINDIDKISKALKEVQQVQNKLGKNTMGISESNMVSQYKDMANVVQKLQKQMSKGLGDDSIKRTNLQISELKTKMSSLYDSMGKNAKSNIDLFNTKQMTKGIADVNANMNKIDTMATSLKTKMNGIEFKNIDISVLDRVNNKISEIQSNAKEDIRLDMNVGDLVNDLNKVQTEIKQLEKVENLASSFNKIESSVKEAFGGEYVDKFKSDLRSLEGLADSLDGSFDKAFKSANNGLKDMSSQIRKMESKSKKSGGIFGSILGSKSDFMSNFASFSLANIAGDLITDIIRMGARELVQTVAETDEAMVNLGKVLPETFNASSKNLQKYQNQATQVAKETGKSTIDVINGTASALQTGIKNIDDALTVSKQSAIFANVGDMEQANADKYIKSTMSAYGGNNTASYVQKCA